MSKKQLNTQAVINELTGQSVFFKKANHVAKPPSLQRGKEAKRFRGKEVSRERGKEGKRLSAEPSVSAGWHEEMVWKGSYLYTERERNLFDEIVLKLRKRYGLEVRKKILARAAIRLLGDDLDRRRKESFLVALLTGRVQEWIEKMASKEVKRQRGKPPKRLAS